MSARLIQTEKLSDHQNAEKAVLDFLRDLPSDYTVYRELQVNSAYKNRMKGKQKGQPDFVVLGPDLGLMSIEVKDWNLVRNEYIWQNQYEVIKKTNGIEERITNPAAQADDYLYAFIELLHGIGIFISSIVVFPYITRASFLNTISNIHMLQNPQSRFLLNLKRTLFQDDIDEFRGHPAVRLKEVAQLDPNFQKASAHQLDAVNERILPSEFRIGDASKRQSEREAVDRISEQQQKWIFGLEGKSNYLLDVAGSGKTNVLVSRAIHTVKKAIKNKENPPRILLTTYNPHLATNIERILSDKITAEERNTTYTTIDVKDVTTLMQEIAADSYDVPSQEYLKADPNPAASLVDDVKGALETYPGRYRVYDYIFIDEIQDFDDIQLFVIRRLARKENYFFVGDIGQKIFDRSHDLSRHGFAIDGLKLEKQFTMYRTPRHIANLANTFIWRDPTLRAEFTQHGYKEDTKFNHQSSNGAELIHAANQISAAITRIHELMSGQFSEKDIMVVCSEGKQDAFESAMKAAGLRFVIGESKQSGPITLVDFMSVKGLERPVVLVTGIEDLYQVRAHTFDDPSLKRKRERLARSQIYVALTRTTEECVVFYSDNSNLYISELITLNRKILDQKQGVW